MVQLSDETIRDFQDIFRQHGKEMTWEEASEAANNLVEFYSLLYKIDRRTRVTETPEKAPAESHLSQMDPDRDASYGR